MFLSIRGLAAASRHSSSYPGSDLCDAILFDLVSHEVWLSPLSPGDRISCDSGWVIDCGRSRRHHSGEWIADRVLESVDVYLSSLKRFPDYVNSLISDAPEYSAVIDLPCLLHFDGWEAAE